MFARYRAGWVALAAALMLATPVGAAQARDGFDPDRFAAPPADSRPTMLWYWNGRVTPGLVDRQLAEMRAKGIREAVLFPFDTPALQPAVFTEAWFDIVEHVLREARRTGMRIWLFNDSFFPSGRGAGLVVNGGRVGDRVYEPHPELRIKGLTRIGRTVSGPAAVRLDAHSSGLVASGGRLVVDAASMSGVAVLDRGAEWTDYTVDARARIERHRAGVMVRSTDERNGILVDFGADVVEVWRQVNGVFTLLSHVRVTSDPGTDHDLKVTVAGDTITPSIDGRALPAVRDATFPRGTVGVRAVATQRSTVDELSVTGADGAALYRQTFDDDDAVDDFAERETGGRVVAAVARPAGSSSAADLIDLTERATNGERWQAPEGDWRVEVFKATPLVEDQPNSFRRYYLDLLDDEAVDRMLDAVPGEYYRRFRWAFGNVLRGFWDDEPMLASAEGSAGFRQLPWSPSLPGALDGVGSTPGLALASAFEDLGRSGRVHRGRYWRAVSDRFADAYHRRQAEWMEQRGVEFISNPLWDEYGPAEQVATTGDALKDHQWAQVPGTDVIFDHYREGGRTLLPRAAASAAHQNGRERVLLEAFGAMGWDVSPQFAYATVGGFAARGVNQTVLHAMWTDPDHVVYPPPFQPENPWWRTIRPLNDWIGRVMEAGRASAPARTALIQPQRAAEAWQGTPAQDAIDRAFTGAANALEDVQVDFDLLDEAALDRDPASRVQARPAGRRLRAGAASYDVVVLPETPTLALEAVERLEALARRGGTVIAVGELPAEEASGRDDELRAALAQLFAARGARRVAAPDGLADAVRGTSAPAAVLEPSAPAVRVLRLKRGDDDAFLVNNESTAAVRTDATFPADGTPERWDPRTGDTRPFPVFRPAGGDGAAGDDRGDHTTVPLRLDPLETLVVAFRRSQREPHLLQAGDLDVREVRAAGRGLRVEALAAAPGRTPLVGTARGRLYRGDAVVTDELRPIALDADWTVRLERDGAEPLLRPLGSWTDVDPAFSGRATYTTTVELNAADLAGRRLALDLGEVFEVAEVEVNGRDFEPRLWTPYRLDVTGALRPGTNEVRVTVTNTLANAHGEARRSGLLGPVRLRPLRPVVVELT